MKILSHIVGASKKLIEPGGLRAVPHSGAEPSAFTRTSRNSTEASHMDREANSPGFEGTLREPVRLRYRHPARRTRQPRPTTTIRIRNQRSS